MRILTRSTALDCVIDDRFDRVIYVIRQGDMGLAIGKKGDNIKRLQNVLGRRIEMVEYAERPEVFIANIFKPAEVTGIERSAEDGPVNVFVHKKSDLGIAIGKAGCNIEKARILSGDSAALRSGKSCSDRRKHESRRKRPGRSPVIRELWEVICERAAHPIVGSYTNRLLNDKKGIDKGPRKGRRGVHRVHPCRQERDTGEGATEEAADLFFHILVALRAADVDLQDVIDAAWRRRK